MYRSVVFFKVLQTYGFEQKLNWSEKVLIQKYPSRRYLPDFNQALFTSTKLSCFVKDDSRVNIWGISLFCSGCSLVCAIGFLSSNMLDIEITGLLGRLLDNGEQVKHMFLPKLLIELPSHYGIDMLTQIVITSYFTLIMAGEIFYFSSREKFQ